MSVFDELRRAWREAVGNFWRELDADDPEGHGRGAYRELARVREHLAELDGALEATRARLAAERDQVAACVRRERLALRIGDAETARVAAEFGARHRERAEVLGRKLDVLEAERGLCTRDLAAMERAVQDGRADGGGASYRPELDDLNSHPRENEFRTLEESDRARRADDRLAELKRKMGG